MGYHIEAAIKSCKEEIFHELITYVFKLSKISLYPGVIESWVETKSIKLNGEVIIDIKKTIPAGDYDLDVKVEDGELWEDN